jgi:chemotaxis-related protein WspB
MLFVVFQLDGNRYAVDTARVAEILPFVEIAEILHAPPEIVGLFSYRGRSIPAIDLSVLLLNRPASAQLSTRIILTRCEEAGQYSGLLGLIVERATEIMRLEPSDFTQSGIASARAPYLGPIAPTPLGLIRRIDLPKLAAACGRHLADLEVQEAS